MDLRKYIDKVAEPIPPGGGSVGNLLFCLGISLIQMAINVSYKGKKDVERLEKIKNRVYPFIKEDTRIFMRFLKSKDPKKKRFYLSQANKICLQLGDTIIHSLGLIDSFESRIKEIIKSDFYLGRSLINLSLKSVILNLQDNNKVVNSKFIEEKIKFYKKYFHLNIILWEK